MTFDPQPVLRGPWLTLRPLEPGDFEALYAVARLDGSGQENVLFELRRQDVSLSWRPASGACRSGSRGR
jgi:hypothetical protein